MTRILNFILLCILLLAGGGLALAQAVVDVGMSGSWYDPAHDGEGFVLEILPNDRAVVYWFTYDETGAQRWFVATGSVAGDTAVFNSLKVPAGAIFGEQFDPEDVIRSEVGELSLTWSDCSSATAVYTVNGVTGSQALTRLTTLEGLDCASPGGDPSPMTGSWYDLTHDGEGLAVEILADGRALAYWFSYDGDGNQAWFVGTGQLDGTVITIPNMKITRGGRFGPDFDPDQVLRSRWGSLEVELGCDYGKFDYDSSLPAFGNGKQTLTRLTSVGEPVCEEETPPNILLVIADDLGKDASSLYGMSAQQAVTPVLDSLAEQGLVFDNAWSNPTCSPTRAGILTGKYGTRTGVLQPTNVLSEDETSLQTYIHQHLPGKYADAVIGKWHLGPQPGGIDHPASLGIGHFAGIIGGGVDDYEDWSLVVNGQRSNETSYATSKLVDLAVEWTGAQDKPWFLWLAFNAPHTPFHLPPASLHDRSLSGSEADIEDNPLPYYFAAIEAMDTELGRLLASFDQQTLDNTIFIFMGDNGTPRQVAQSPYSRQKSKGSLYQGGINIPFFISGPGITRSNERESALVNTTDLFSTIAALAGVNVDTVNDSTSFTGMLSEAEQPGRLYQFTEMPLDPGYQWVIADGVYKLFETDDGDRELYHLGDDPYEESDLLAAGSVLEDVTADLQYLADQVWQGAAKAKGYSVADTNQEKCYGAGAEITCPARLESFFGQDAQFAGNPPAYTDNGDGTVADNVTGLVWQQSPDLDGDGTINSLDKLTHAQAQTYCEGLELAEYDDW